MIVFILLLINLCLPYSLYCDNKEEISANKWCNGLADCSDKSDEKPRCCPAGLHRVNNICQDINECDNNATVLACSQHCRNSDGSFECSCDEGFALTLDPTSRETYCQALGDDVEFMLSVDNRILISTDLNSFASLQMGDIDSHHVYDFDYDYANSLVFWCSGDKSEFESSMHKILWKATYLNGLLTNVEPVVDHIDCVSLAVDWVNEKVYWVTKDTGHLVVSSYNGNDKMTLLYKDLDMLRAIAVSPGSGYVFWSDWGRDPHIGRANMDGSEQMFLLRASAGDQINRPTSLTIDHNTNRLYWIDANYRSLHVMDFEGRSSVLLSDDPFLTDAWRMAIFQDRIYWTDVNLGSMQEIPLKSINKRNGKDFNVSYLSVEGNVSGLRMFHAVVQPSLTNACDGHHCEHLCLLSPAGSSCKCDNGYVLTDNNVCLAVSPICHVDSCDPLSCNKCGDGTCYLQMFRCDGKMDCEDGSDETDCAPSNGRGARDCSVGTEYACNNGLQCIRSQDVCDNEKDCDDGSDEEPIMSCNERNQCSREDFVCDGSTCLHRDQRCNGVRDCDDGTDEEGCSETRCDDYTQFTCMTSRACIPREQRCDGSNDCADWSDEYSCPTVCREWEFACGSRECIPVVDRCDGNRDCLDGSDELNCSAHMCEEGKVTCGESSRQCILAEQECDKKQDCENNHDEIGCDCAEGMIPCANSEQCIRPEQYCDGNHNDCPSDTDEPDRCCKRGYARNATTTECSDVDECATHDGSCSQHCNNTDGGFTCSCDEGYVLEVKAKNRRGINKLSYCRAIGPMKIIVTVHEKLPRYLTYSEDTRRQGDYTSIPISGEYDPFNNLMFDIDFDYRNNKIMWCTSFDIWIADLAPDFESITNSRAIVRNVDVESIAVDWINQLIYFTSPKPNTIEVVDYGGVNRRAIIWENLDKPRAIDLDPESGLLFYTDWGVNAHLGRSNLDGGDLRILVNNTATTTQIQWPNAMTIDHPNKNVYWMDSGMLTIECMTYDGSASYTVSSKNMNLKHPWRMRVFEDRVFWKDFDSDLGSTRSMNKFNGAEFIRRVEGTTSREGTSGEGKGWGLRLYHPVIQPQSESRCKPSSCSKLCLATPGGYSCACPTGHRLLYDKTTCSSTMGMYAFIAMHTTIVKMALEPLEPIPQPIQFEHRKGNIYWSLDYHNGWLYYNSISEDKTNVSIHRMSNDGTEPKVVVNERSNGGLSIDWLNEKIYWCSTQTVSVGELDGSVHTTLLQKEGYDFRDILVDPRNGYIYLAAWEMNKDGSGIFRVSMDGNIDTFTEIISQDRFNETFRPSSLTLDSDTGSLFFSNKRSLYRVSMWEDSYEIIEIDTGTNPDPTATIKSADIWRDKIIWTEYVHDGEQQKCLNRVMAAGKLGGPSEPIVIRDRLCEPLFGIKVHPRAASDNRGQNPCLDHSCSHMCLQSQMENGTKTHRCVCPTGYALKENSTTECADEIAQYLVYNPTTGIQTVSLDTSFLTPIKEPRNMDFKVTVFDLDARNNWVYYCHSNPNKFEGRKLFDDSAKSWSLPIHTIQCSGMAVEWITNKLYIVDKGNSPDSGLILVIDIARPFLMKHIVTNLREPLDVVVHPAEGKIYWILASHNIMSTNMDGTAMIETIVSYDSTNQIVSEPRTQLFMDFESNSLYWTENVEEDGSGYVGLIKKVRLSDKRVETVHRERMTLSGVTLINGNLYFSSNQGILYRLDQNKGTYLLQAGEDTSALFLRSSNSQYSADLVNNACADTENTKNGGCSDFCLLDVKGRAKCSCPTGIQLKDSLNCDTPFNKTLVVANATRISMISLANSDKAIDRVLTGAPKSLRSIDVDIRENKIYWSEINSDNTGAIWMLDIATGTTEKIVHENIIHPNSIAVDWNAQNLYWVDLQPNYGQGTLEVISLRTLKRRILKKFHGGHDKKPHQIVVDPNDKRLFVSYPTPFEETLTRMWLDGSNNFGIRDEHQGTVTDLAIDITSKRLYWSWYDKEDYISTCDYLGKNRNLINLHKNRGDLISVLNKNVFVPNSDFDKSKVQIDVYDYKIDNTIPVIHKYTFHHLTGAIASMKVSAVNVLEDSSVSCRANECRDRTGRSDSICIPNDIDFTCWCADNDTACQEANEQQNDYVVNLVPGHPINTCPDNWCHGNGVCMQIRSNSTPDFRCECDVGFATPRCKQRRNDKISYSLRIVLPILVFIVLLIIGLVWLFNHSTVCCNGSKAARLHESSEGDETETDQPYREPQTEKLAKLQKKGIGRSYYQVNNRAAEENV